MRAEAVAAFESFAHRFVWKYWETVKSAAFPMEGDEPIQESVNELVAAISVEIEPQSLDDANLRRFRMENTHGDWWHFAFREENGEWLLTGSTARSHIKGKPHDLLGKVYEHSFGPFLRYVTTCTNIDETT